MEKLEQTAMSDNTKDTPIETVRISYKQEECSKALRGLYNTVDETIAGDVDNKVSAYVYELKTRIKFLEELLNEDLHEENASLKLELQKQKEEIQHFELERTEMYHKYEKQKELNAELVKIKNLVEDLIEVPHFRNQWETTTEAFESLIKKSSEI